MKLKPLDKYNSFMDQEDPPVPVYSCIAEADFSEPYEVDEAAIFTTKNGFVGVIISGCS